MTAMNVFVQPDAAYLLTDTAWVGEDGIVAEIGPKALEMSLVPAAMAVMGSSGFDPDVMIAHIERANLFTLEALLLVLPEIFRTMKDDADALWPGDEHNWGLGIAAFNYSTGQPEAYRCDTFSGWLHPGYVPFSLQPLLAAINDRRDAEGNVIGLDDMLGRPVQITHPHSFDPRVDGLKLIEAQRALPLVSFEGDVPQLAVGGQAVLTRVDAQGARSEVLTTWPDKVGEPINLTTRAN